MEEKENPTHFAIKVSGPDEDTSKRTMLKCMYKILKSEHVVGFIFPRYKLFHCTLSALNFLDNL